jgi:hypothetical protein
MKRGSQFKAKATPKYQQYNREQEQDHSRQNSNRSGDVDHTPNDDVLVWHCQAPQGVSKLGQFGEHSIAPTAEAVVA